MVNVLLALDFLPLGLSPPDSPTIGGKQGVWRAPPLRAVDPPYETVVKIAAQFLMQGVSETVLSMSLPCLSRPRYAGTNPWWKKNLKYSDPSKCFRLSISYSLRPKRKKSACKYSRYTPKGVFYSIWAKMVKKGEIWKYQKIHNSQNIFPRTF